MDTSNLRELFSIFHNLDKHDLEQAGVIEPGKGSDHVWVRFNTDLTTFVLKLSPEKLQKLEELVNARRRERI
jgi:hypothetical protein